MEVAFIAPTDLLWTVGSMTKYHMVLPEQLSTTTYNNFYQNTLGHKILDNGVAESGKPTSIGELLRLAHQVEANEIVVPDVMNHTDATIQLAEVFASVCGFVGKGDGRMRYMGVVQGNTMSDFYRCTEFWLSQPWIDSIAFPRCMQVRGFGARIEAIEYWQDAIIQAGKETHCLGSMQRLDEAKHLADLKVRGIDTCAPIDFARVGISLSQGEKHLYYGRTERYFDWHPTAEESRLVISNCNTYLEWCQGGAPDEPIP